MEVDKESSKDCNPEHKYARDHNYSVLHKPDVESKSIEVQTDLSMDDIKAMEKEIMTNVLVERLTKSDAAVKRNFGVPSVHILFGLFAILNSAFTNIKYWSGKESTQDKRYEVGQSKKPDPSRKMTRVNEFLMTLLRIRQAVSTSLLADLFGIAESRVSQIFCIWSNVMYRVFGPQIKWPSRSHIVKFMPRKFKSKFP